MNKLVKVLVALGVVGSLVACSNKKEEQPKDDKEQVVEEETTENKEDKKEEKTDEEKTNEEEFTPLQVEENVEYESGGQPEENEETQVVIR